MTHPRGDWGRLVNGVYTVMGPLIEKIRAESESRKEDESKRRDSVESRRELARVANRLAV